MVMPGCRNCFPSVQVFRPVSYIKEHGLQGNAKLDIPLFYNQRHTALTRGGITHILQKYVNKAGCPDMPSKTTLHVLRHSKAMYLLQAGIKIVLIRDILGHVSVQITDIVCQNGYGNQT
jgi:site-specific recombinase XerD